MLKSGSEFREFSAITVTFPDSQDSSHRPGISVERQEVTKNDIPDEEMEAIVQKYLNKASLLYCH